MERILILSGFLTFANSLSTNNATAIGLSNFLQYGEYKRCLVKAASLDGDYFRHLMETKDEVDLVRLQLDWGGKDFNFTSNQNFDPNTWVWASQSSGEALLSLPFDVDILSLGTITKDVYNMKVAMTIEPEVCNQLLSDAEKNFLVAEALYENVTSGYDNAVLCHRVVTQGANVLEYRCCELYTNNSTHFDCDIIVRKQAGVIFSLMFIEALSVIAVIYLPAIMNYLPHPRHDDQSEFGTEKRLMYLNVEVPVGVGKLWRIIYRCLSSRAKRGFLIFLILPGMTVTWNLLYFFFKNQELSMRISRGIVTPWCTFPFLRVYFDPSPLKIAGVSILVTAMFFIALVALIPGKTDVIYQSLSARESRCICITCRVIYLSLDVPAPLVDMTNINCFQSYLFAHLKSLPILEINSVKA